MGNMAAGVHGIGRLPLNILRLINKFANTNTNQIAMSSLLQHARVMRATKGLFHLESKPKPGSVYTSQEFYDPVHNMFLRTIDLHKFNGKNFEKK